MNEFEVGQKVRVLKTQNGLMGTYFSKGEVGVILDIDLISGEYLVDFSNVPNQPTYMTGKWFVNFDSVELVTE